MFKNDFCHFHNSHISLASPQYYKYQMMKTILYAADFSENSISALKSANVLAKKFDSKLIVMHVFDIPISIVSPVSVSYMRKEKRLFVENRKKLKEFCLKNLGQKQETSNFHFVVDENVSITDSIIEKAMKFDVDLVVLGTKGASAIKDFFLGSTAKGILRKAPCPVLAVPEKSDLATIKRIAYATDFDKADIFAINKLAKIAKKLGAEIRVVHVTTPKEYAGEEQMEWFKDMLKEKVDYAKMEFDLIFSDTIFEELLWYIQNTEVNLLAMLERKDNNLYQKYIQSDLVKRMVKNIDVPLLSFSVSRL